MQQVLNHRLRVILVDGRVLIGQMLAFDKHMNLVLADCEEIRQTKRAIKQAKKMALGSGSKPANTVTGAIEGAMKRSLGLVILRGEHVVSFCVEGGPPPVLDAKTRVSAATMLGQGAGSHNNNAANAAAIQMRHMPPPVMPLPGTTMLPPMMHGRMPPPPFPPPVPGAAFPMPPPFPLPPGMSFPAGMPLPPGMSIPSGMPFPPGMVLPAGMPFPGMPPAYCESLF
jgi:small nuclear ribonucleoprotein B and B'